MRSNDQIAQIFDEIGDILEILGENVFRIRAYRRAAEAVRNVGLDLRELPEEELDNIPGVGKDLQQKIVVFLETGGCEMHERLVEQIGQGVLEILRVRGIGPKKVKLFRDELGVDNLDKLRAAAEAGELAKLPHMGEKSQASILEALNTASYSKERINYADALPVAKDFMDYMRECDAVDNIDYAGSLRRERDTIGDIDLLVATADAPAVHAHFTAYDAVQTVLGSGATKSSVVLGGNMQVDLRTVEPESYGAALMYFTGSKQFNIKTRTLALKQGLKVNEYGLFRGEEKIGGETEMSMFEGLGMDYVAPNQRED